VVVTALATYGLNVVGALCDHHIGSDCRQGWARKSLSGHCPQPSVRTRPWTKFFEVFAQIPVIAFVVIAACSSFGV